MSLTRFPYGVSSFGAPILPWPGLVPSTTSGQGQTPGGCYFVNGDIGNDGYGGTSPQQPFKTLDRAYNACYGGTERSHLRSGRRGVRSTFQARSPAAALASCGRKAIPSCRIWRLPAQSGQRAHISNGASTNLYHAAHSGCGNGCYFSNVEIFNGGADATKAACRVLVYRQLQRLPQLPNFRRWQCDFGGGQLLPVVGGHWQWQRRRWREYPLAIAISDVTAHSAAATSPADRATARSIHGATGRATGSHSGRLSTVAL